ncbi:ExbD/TolR family protein [Granulosicoccus sp. 3-233]|uniref:ExbD/TolR family protein n=1 Tax=Granulosicoccus sp. 3-233 TaxID=3417969 RepID=UPI003D33D1E6
MSDYLQSPDQLRSVSRRKSSSDENMIPLINIVFLLLIFFMVAGQIQPQDGSDIRPPVAADMEVNTPPVVDVQINRQNEIQLDGVAMSLSDLQRALSGERYANAEQLLIKADRDVKAADLGVLLDGLRQSGIGSIRLLTEKSGS